MISRRLLAFSFPLLAALASSAPGQESRPWKHGVIEPKGDAGFMLMVGQRDFGQKRGLRIEIVPLKNGATAHKALLSGELDSIESSPGPTIPAGGGWVRRGRRAAGLRRARRAAWIDGEVGCPQRRGPERQADRG